MLENLPSALGHALEGVRPGPETLLTAGLAAPATIALTSPAFADGAAIPAEFTADGEGHSPPLAWTGVPEGAAALLLIVEDADSPTPEPLVHAIVPTLPPRDGELAAGALPSAADPEAGTEMGRNSYLRARYLPMDPPPGHGAHRYVFQIVALRDHPPALTGDAGRGALRDALAAGVLGVGRLTGTYARS